MGRNKEVAKKIVKVEEAGRIKKTKGKRKIKVGKKGERR